MTDFDLESKLKSVPLPERPPEYWNHFPAQVRAGLRRAPIEYATRHSRLPWLAWGGGFAMACVIFSLSAWPAFHGLLQNEKAFRRELAQFPGHLRVLMQDEHGLHYLIADQP
jgi:hypothetical protein